MIIPLEQKAETACFCDACELIRERDKWLDQHYDCPVNYVLSIDNYTQIERLNCRRHNKIFMNKTRD